MGSELKVEFTYKYINFRINLIIIKQSAVADDSYLTFYNLHLHHLHI